MSASQQPLPYSGVSMSPPDRQASPQLSLLGSNNPFRNRAMSPAVNPGAPRTERSSTNPFMDDTDALSPQSAPSLQPVRPLQPEAVDNTRELFENLSVKPSSRPAPPRPDESSKYRPSTGRADRDRRERSSRERPERSERSERERSERRERASRERGSRERSERRERPSRRDRERDLDIFADPPPLQKSSTSAAGRPRERRPRRNSESSIMEKPRLADSEEDRRRRERRRREREREGRHRDGKSSRSKRPVHMDIIDKLDVTGIYGTGMFHHDGPFDACNPNRNRKGVRAAPLHAFPEDSSNMALGGAGPVNKNIDLDLFHGRNPEGWNDYASTGTAPDSVGRSAEGVNFDPTTRIEPVHGPTSLGLGTSTFLDGAPASRSAMARRTSETEGMNGGGGGGGLQRKKSLAQRIRGGINRAPSARVTSPESYAGPAAQRVPERNVTSPDSDDAVEKKQVRIAGDEMRPQTAGRARSASSPKQSTSFNQDRTVSSFDDKPGGGFLNRMKSLRKPVPKRQVSDD